MPRHIIAIDLFLGDSGKGTITDSLCRQYGIDTVARFSGGCQAAHSVVLPDGTHHVFAQYGSGTFTGALTFLLKDMMVDPLRLVKEGQVLESKGISRALKGLDGIMHIDERCLVTTPYHAAINQAREVRRDFRTDGRGNQRHGSCGVGIGETASFALKHPNIALRIGDLLDPKLMREKLKAMEDILVAEYRQLGGIEDAPITNPDHLDALCWRYTEFTKLVRIFPELEGYIAHRNVVFEGSQGVLLDEDYGFHPYTTWSRVTSRNAAEALKTVGITDYTTIGIMRTYGHRHGAGPFPTEGAAYHEPHNGDGPWQGAFRTGLLDIELLRYALKVNPVDYLAVTHMDRLPPQVEIATAYKTMTPQVLDPQDFVKREEQTKELMKVTLDDCWTINPPKSEFASAIETMLNTRVGITSSGPTHLDKTYDSFLTK